MPTYRIRNLVTAIGLAALATALTAVYVTGYKGRVNRGEQLVPVFVAPSAQGPRGGLSGTVRLMAVPGDPDQLLAGVLKAGDHVDVIAALKGNGLGSGNSSQILLRDLRVVTPAD